MSVENILINKIDLVEYISEITPVVNGRCACPIHGGDNPTSMAVTPKRFHCFACPASGTIIDFVSQYENLPYFAAVEKLADKLNISIKDSESYQKCKSLVEENQYMAKYHHANVGKAMDYLTKKRALTKETIEKFQLGYDEDGMSIVIPLIEYDGRHIAIAKRQLKRDPKYINDRNNEVYDKSAFLYNLVNAKNKIKDSLIICEGYFDAMSADQQGLPAVAFCGSEIHNEQINLLKQFIDGPEMTVILAPDNDGKTKTKKIREKFLSIAPKLNVMVMVMPDGIKDLNDALIAKIDIKGIPLQHIDLYVLEQMLCRCESEYAQYNVVTDFIRTVKSPMVRLDIAEFLSNFWGKDIDYIKKWFDVINAEGTEELLKDFVFPDVGTDRYREMIMKEGLSLGFPTIDASLGGIRRGEVLFFGAYSSVGKTWLAVDFAIHNVIRNNANVIFFSLEMSAAALYERIIGNILGINTRVLEQKIKNGELLDAYEKINEKLQKHLVVIDRSSMAIEDMQRRIALANSTIFEKPCDMIIIDYLQYMKDTHNYEGLSKVARAMKPLAKDSDVAVVCLSQLNRQGSTWERPNMKMLRGTGDIESTGDYVIMGYRPGENPTLSVEQRDGLKNILNICIDKGRRGYEAREIEAVLNFDVSRVREKSSKNIV